MIHKKIEKEKKFLENSTKITAMLVVEVIEDYIPSLQYYCGKIKQNAASQKDSLVEIQRILFAVKNSCDEIITRHRDAYAAANVLKKMLDLLK